MVAKKYYDILSLKEGATLAEIKRKYKELALKRHPDKGGSEEKMKELNEAYEILSSESSENGSIKEYGYDYGDTIPTGESALVKYSNNLKSLNEAQSHLSFFYSDNEGYRTKGNIVSDFHLIRTKNLLKILNSYYKSKYLAAKGEMDRAEIVKGFRFWDNGNGLSSEVNWNNNFNRIKKMLDYALDSLGLNKLTDKDLQIEVKSPNETPQIPDNDKNPKPIKDGVANIEEYNNLYHRGNHETIRKYWELRDTIYNTVESWNKYTAVNSTLLKEIESKSIEAEKGTFWEIWAKDDEAKIEKTKNFNESKLAKMKEVIKSMEKIIEEGKNYQPTTENAQSESKKHKVDEFEAHQEVAERNKTVGDELSRLIQEAQELTNYKELEAKIKEIDKYQGEVSYNEQHQEGINQLKIKLGGLDKDKFKARAISKIESEMEGSGVKESDLDEETKQQLVAIKSEKDVNKITELENKISEKVGKKEAENSLSKLLEEAKNLVNNVAKGTVETLRKQVQQIKKELYGYRYSTNNYKISAYQAKENDVRAMLTKLENHSVQNNDTQPSGGFFRPEIIIPLVLATVLVATVATVLVRRRRQAKVK